MSKKSHTRPHKELAGLSNDIIIRHAAYLVLAAPTFQQTISETL